MTEPAPPAADEAPASAPEHGASGLPRLPAPARLKRLLEALARALPGELATLLAAPRFAPGAAALTRLTDPAQREAAVRQLAPAETEWIAGELLRRWERLAAPRLPPAIAIRVPDGPRDSARAERIVLQLCAEGILPDWTARWHGAEPASDGASASVSVRPATGGQASPVTVRVHVHARGEVDGARHALVAEATIPPPPS